MYDWVKAAGFEPVIIATKLDKIKRSQLLKQLSLIRKTLGAPEDVIMIPFSAQTKQGRDEIWATIEEKL